MNPLSPSSSRLLVVQVAALGWELLRRHGGERLDDLAFAPLETPFPALTCPVQATFRTGLPPAAHGVVANGGFDRISRRTAFWEQSAALVAGPRIWERFRAAGRSVALLFWQQSLGEAADMLLSPAPIHKHHGGMIQDCYAQPAALYAELCRRIGRPFDLMHYWGPLASARSTRWIVAATCEVLAGCPQPPDLCLTYLPLLDYDLQRHGPDDARSLRALAALLAALRQLRQACDRHGYELLIYGDYAIAPCRGGAIFPNRALRAAGLLRTRAVRGRHYLDLHASRALALVDHQMAHLFVRDAADLDAAAGCLRALPGIERVADAAAVGLGHAQSGERIVLAAPGHWLAYPWWEARAEAPDYAGHVDIHSKPGYDPCELFWGWPPGTVGRDPGRISGTHGLAGPGHEACWAATFLAPQPCSLEQLSAQTRAWLEEKR